MSTYEIIGSDPFSTCIYCGTTLSPEQYGMFMSKEDVTDFFRPVIAIKDEKLTDSELAVLRAFVFFDTSK